MTPSRRFQRLGAYAVVVDCRRLLVTRISPRGYPVGAWTLPGGGVDHGESPHDAVRRELYEETGLEALSARLVDVHDVHVVGTGRDDRHEDYHGVHLLYSVEVDTSITPRVTELDGSTDLAAWVDVDELAGYVKLPMLEHVLQRLDQFLPGV